MARAIVIALAAAVVGVAAYTSLRHGEHRGLGTVPTKGAIVDFAYSPNQEKLLLPLILEFNNEHHVVDGDTVFVSGQNRASGEVEASVANGTYKPTAWAPASSLWGRLLNYQAHAAWVPDENPSIVRTPLVIALWKPEAEALGWPHRPIGFERILALATSRRGWADYGLPTFGRFKLGHTNPDFSTSGLSFVAAQYYMATGKREGLTVADVRRRAVRSKVHLIQQSIVHYGDTSQFFLDELRVHGPGYVSALAMEEVSLLDYNHTRPQGSMPLVAVYPAEGTFYFDNPLIILHAPWVSAAKARAAKVFERWLLPRLTPGLAARYGYRPGGLQQRPAAPIDREHFVDPAQPRIVLSLPEPRVLAAIKTAWHADRKAANVEVVVDTSGSMQEQDKLAQAQLGLQVFLGQFSARDRVGLMTFSQSAQTIVPLRQMKVNRAMLRAAVRELTAAGGTAVYDATAQAIAQISALDDSTRINAVVVLTDGEDNRSRLTELGLVARLKARAEDQEHNVRVFTIAYGSEANKADLASIATASGGSFYVGDPAQIAGVYRQIASFF
jgi:Ca-activated chloride channel homolog